MDRGQQSLATVARNIAFELDIDPSLRRMTWTDGRSPHRCEGYVREEITLATTTLDSAVVAHDVPGLSERCSVCHEIVGLNETFRCVCGDSGPGSRHTIKCQVCKCWSHSDCIGNSKRDFTCRLCNGGNNHHLAQHQAYTAQAQAQNSFRRPYGGLVPSQPKGTRAYQDAASYNHHLAQHQAYTAQAQAQNSFRNPYITPNSLTPVLNRDDAMREWERRQAGKPSAAQPYPQLEYLQQQAELAAQAGTATNWARYQPPPVTGKLPSAAQPYPQLEYLQQQAELAAQAGTTTNWARYQPPPAGKPSAAQPYPQLEYLQQQAELAAQAGTTTNWARYQPPPVTSKRKDGVRQGSNGLDAWPR
ncbi:hypothetical protein K438DRAFT_8478 [Mycena galopus ATCC 62051]|nr:hypothetical protein K438DRAFT_8478 [Mycena galopus ATCC 62051]